MFKIREDPRVTRIGQLLRRFSLDEFPAAPERGARRDEYLVGPRPLILEGRRSRRLVGSPPPAAQARDDRPVAGVGAKLDPVRGGWCGSTTSTVTTSSLAHDIRLILKTFPLVFGGERGGHW